MNYAAMSIIELYKIFTSHPVVTTDTRDCPEGSLFFALKGERFNGNAFAEKAILNGCAYAVVDEDVDVTHEECRGRLIRVEDVLHTLQDLAHYHRMQFKGPVIQITGTNGKTTTKELVSAVLSEAWQVHYTQGNFNNHIGVPKTLLQLPFTTDAEEKHIAVVETGANHPGEIAMLSKIVDADCGLITNVGRAHLEGFGSFEGVIRTKTELYAYLQNKPDSFIFLHGDNSTLKDKANSYDLPTIVYGSTGKGYEVEGDVMECTPFVKFRWHVSGQEWHEVQTQLIGAYNIDNLLAAIAVGLRFGVSSSQICHALASYTPRLGRSELKRTSKNTLILDAYNANVTSMHAALDNFEAIKAPRKMAILGEMRELGSASKEGHMEILQQALSLHLEALWLVGEEFRKVGQGMARCFDNVEQVKEAIKVENLSGYLVLVKGSNGTHLYELPEYL